MSTSRNATLKHKSTTNGSSHQLSVDFLPVPSPEIMQKYEAIKPGIIDEFLDIARKEQSNRHIFFEKEQNNKLVGMRYAVLSIVFLVGLCSYGFYCGFGTQAATIATGVIATVAIAFLRSK